ncbi:MAG TPA: hypothetical protein VN873_05010 [Candidatus Angelobacter sp.]|nr:hypothetical protein [Candidatus Angelobacter sp.]
MNDQLIEILGLNSDATEDAIIAAVKALKDGAVSRAAFDAREKKIRAKILESCGALDRENAILAIEAQGGFDS